MKKFNEWLQESTNWPYYWIKDGDIVDKKGKKAFNNSPKFKDIKDAEEWLTSQDERGNIVGEWSKEVASSPIKEKKMINLGYEDDPEDIACAFAKWIHRNVKLVPDGWHYKGKVYSTDELYNVYMEFDK